MFFSSLLILLSMLCLWAGSGTRVANILPNQIRSMRNWEEAEAYPVDKSSMSGTTQKQGLGGGEVGVQRQGSVSSSTSCAGALCTQPCTNNRWGFFSTLLFNGSGLDFSFLLSCLQLSGMCWFTEMRQSFISGFESHWSIYVPQFLG